MGNDSAPPSKSPRPRRKATAGSGAVAQGRRATAAGKQAVIVQGTSSAPIHTGQGDINLIQNAPRPGAGAADLREAYLAWISACANELPLLAAESGKPVQLRAIYTALLTEERQAGEEAGRAADLAELARGKGKPSRLSALEALDRTQHLVLMGGPGSGKSTFLNFVALCMAGESLGAPANLALLRAPLPPGPDEGDRKPRPQRWRHEALLPVRVVLRDFAATLPAPGTAVNADTLWRFIVAQLPAQLGAYADDLQAELLGKGALVLLDGLDEVPDALQRREQVKQAVQDFAAMNRKCRFLVTSRTYAYQHQDWKLDGFTERELLPFGRGQIERFIDGWYAHMTELFRLTEADATARAALLKRATLRPELTELAERPLLLTLMARLQTKGGGTLPENREALYAESVDMLLDEWEGLKLKRDPATGEPVVAEPSLSEWLDASRDGIRRELDRLAYEAHLKQPELVGSADIRQKEIEDALMAASKSRPDSRPRRLEEYLRDRSGLLTAHGEAHYQFPHRSFQEYLAACHLARFDFPDTLCRLAKADPNRWREVALLAAARSRGVPAAIWELVEELCAKDEAPPEDAPEPPVPELWGALLAAQVLAETGLSAPDPQLQARHERKRLRVRDWQLGVLRSRSLPARERALAGDLLDRLGDPRRALLEVDEMRFRAVPAGAFWMGDGGSGDAPLHLNDGLSYDYWISEAPVTVAQYAQFLAASGAGGESQRGPAGGPGNRPVTSVDWHQAIRFCDWLGERWRACLPAGWRVMLPSEAEWEKAARGGVAVPSAPCITTRLQGFEFPAIAQTENPMPQRRYPWADEWLEDHANTRESGIGETCTAGIFDRGRSGAGCLDMGGNVLEWTRSLWGEDLLKPRFVYPYDPDDGAREDLQAVDEVRRVVRGGSWNFPRAYARCAYRYLNHPAHQFDYLGFRVALRSPHALPPLLLVPPAGGAARRHTRAARE